MPSRPSDPGPGVLAAHGGRRGPDQAVEEAEAEAAAAAGPCDVTVVLMGELKRLAGLGEVVFRLPVGATVHDVAHRLRTVCPPAFTMRVLTPDGDLQPHVAAFLDGVQLPTARGAPTAPVGGRLELMLVPMYEGG